MEFSEQAELRGLDEVRLRARAERRLLARKGLTWHAAAYVIVNALLWSVWVTTSLMTGKWHYVWPVWPTLAWGAGLAFHAVSYHNGQRNAGTHEQRVRAEMDRLKGR